MFGKAYKFFNQPTRQAMLEKVGGYVEKDQSIQEHVRQVQAQHQPERILRFDLGIGFDGYSPRIQDFLLATLQDGRMERMLNEYPETTHAALRELLAQYFGISAQQVVLSAGLDSILDLITRVFFDPLDKYLMPIPAFYLFELYSERMGAVPIFLQLREENQFRWTHNTTAEFKELISRFHPKIAWLSNPSNPTGQVLPLRTIRELVDFAASYNTFVVVDEAYGEYTDDLPEGSSAAGLLNDFENLMVLRTFSKGRGLAGIRLGYLMTSSAFIRDAIQQHRHAFPVSQLSYEVAKLSLEDEAFLHEVRLRTRSRVQSFFRRLETLGCFGHMPTLTSVFMLQNRHLSAGDLYHQFLKHGIFTSKLNISGLKANRFLRVTARSEEDNAYFVEVCRRICNEHLEAQRAQGNALAC
jgi:histidinol-phosphate aminotransferase